MNANLIIETSVVKNMEQPLVEENKQTFGFSANLPAQI